MLSADPVRDARRGAATVRLAIKRPKRGPMLGSFRGARLLRPYNAANHRNDRNNPTAR